MVEEVCCSCWNFGSCESDGSDVNGQICGLLSHTQCQTHGCPLIQSHWSYCHQMGEESEHELGEKVV